MPNIQNKKSESDAKASRAKYKVRELLKKVLDLVNLVPPDVEIPSLEDAINAAEAEFEAIGDYEGAMMKHVEKPLMDALEQMPEDFRKHVLAVRSVFGLLNDDASRVVGAASEYTFIRESRLKLESLITLASRPPEHRSFTLWVVPSSADNSLRLDENNIVQSLQDRFTLAVQGVDASRFRRCEYCRCFFWAGNIQKTCCSKEHAHAVRSKRWRDNYQSKYKLQRSGEKPLTSKEKKRLEEKINGKASTKKGK